jgi:hypothetical protein
MWKRLILTNSGVFIEKRQDIFTKDEHQIIILVQTDQFEKNGDATFVSCLSIHPVLKGKKIIDFSVNETPFYRASKKNDELRKLIDETQADVLAVLNRTFVGYNIDRFKKGSFKVPYTQISDLEDILVVRTSLG